MVYSSPSVIEQRKREQEARTIVIEGDDDVLVTESIDAATKSNNQKNEIPDQASTTQTPDEQRPSSSKTKKIWRIVDEIQ